MKTEIELAKQAGWEYADDDRGFEPLWRFAELVRADEREACAKVCEGLLDRPSGYQGTWEGYGKFKTQMTGQECAAAIRNRSNT
jgi:hypothetical protein